MICVYPEYHEGWILLILLIGTVKSGFAGADKTADTTGYLQCFFHIRQAQWFSWDAMYPGITPEPTVFVNIPDLSPGEYTWLFRNPITWIIFQP